MGSRDEDLHLVEAVALSMFYVARWESQNS